MRKLLGALMILVGALLLIVAAVSVFTSVLPGLFMIGGDNAAYAFGYATGASVVVILFALIGLKLLKAGRARLVDAGGAGSSDGQPPIVPG